MNPSLIIVLSCLIGISIATSSLSILVEKGKDECFYLSKKSGETITASFQILHGDFVDFAILDPRANIVYERRNSDGYELEQKVHIGGDYGFCFTSTNNKMPSGVHFEWDFHLGSQEEATFTKKLEEEKRKFLMNKVKENKPKVVGGAGKEGIAPVEMHDPNDNQFEDLEMDSVAHAILLLSFNADRMLHYMNMHKSKQALSHNVQMRNNSYISYFSTAVCLTVMVMALIQVVVVKSFFSGKINLKVWEF